MGLFDFFKKKDANFFIDNDPELQKLDAEIRDINKGVNEIVKNDKELNNLLERHGFHSDDSIPEFKNSQEAIIYVNKIKEDFFLKLNSSKEQKYLSEYLHDSIKDLFEEAKIEQYFGDDYAEGWKEFIKENDLIIEREKEMILKYNFDKGSKISQQEIWIDMESSELEDSRGYPDKKELTESEDDASYETWTYGNKLSGSHFHLRNGFLIKFVDRKEPKNRFY